MPAVSPRRPFDNDKPNGYLESFRDYTDNNVEAVTWFLEHAAVIRARLNNP